MIDWPSSLQAFAAIVALGLSTWSIRETRAAARKALIEARADAKVRDDLKARMVAASIVTEFEILKGEIDRGLYALSNRKSLEGQKNYIDAEVVNNVKIYLPPMIEKNLDRMHWLGDSTGETMLLFVSMIMGYNQFVNKKLNEVQYYKLISAEDWSNAVNDHLNLLEMTLQKARNEVEALHFASDNALVNAPKPWWTRPPR